MGPCHLPLDPSSLNLNTSKLEASKTSLFQECWMLECAAEAMNHQQQTENRNTELRSIRKLQPDAWNGGNFREQQDHSQPASCATQNASFSKALSLSLHPPSSRQGRLYVVGLLGHPVCQTQPGSITEQCTAHWQTHLALKAASMLLRQGECSTEHGMLQPWQQQ